MRHPGLAKKLQLLYSLQINPAIKNHSSLAAELGISRQAVSRWCRGTASSHGDSIPHLQVRPVAELFGIEAVLLTLPYEEFETRVRQDAVDRATEARPRVKQVSSSTMPVTSLNLFGREQELELLQSHWRESQTNVVQLIAFGGVGKSSLVNRWLSELSKDNYGDAERVYAWSFYWQSESSQRKSSGDFFIEHALEWFGDKDPSAGDPWGKAARLAQLVRGSRTLLILDGLEAVQSGPGPELGLIENFAVACLVRELCEENPGLCLVTSRLPVRDLANFTDGRIATIELGQLSNSAGADYLRSLGVVGEMTELEQAGARYKGHALSLSLLGGYLNVVHDGDIKHYKSMNSLFGESALDSHAKNVLAPYLEYFQDSHALEILFMLGLIDRAIDLAELQSICGFRNIDGLTTELNRLSQAQWRFGIQHLQDSKLVTTRQTGRTLMLDCHPIIRNFSLEFLKSRYPENWTAGNRLLFDFLQGAVINDPSNIQEFEPLFRAVIYGIHAGDVTGAFELYFHRIKKGHTLLAEGSHYSDQKCIRAFFEQEWSVPNPELPPPCQFHLLASAGANLMMLGNLQEAMEPSLISIDYFMDNQMWPQAAQVVFLLILAMIKAGQLEKALEMLEKVDILAEKITHPVMGAMLNNIKGYVCHLNGRHDEARRLFEAMDEVLRGPGPEEGVNFPIFNAYCNRFLLDTGTPEQVLERCLRIFAWRERGSWQAAVSTPTLLASDLMALGLAFVGLGDRVNAAKHLKRMMELSRSSGEGVFLPHGLAAHARLHIATGDLQAAEADLREAIETARIMDNRFGEWGACLDLAGVYLRQENHALARRLFSEARSMQGMASFHFRDREIAELEQALAVQGAQVQDAPKG